MSENTKLGVVGKPPYQIVTPTKELLEIKYVRDQVVSELSPDEQYDVLRSWRIKYKKPFATPLPEGFVVAVVQVNPQVIVRINSRGPIINAKKKAAYVEKWRNGEVATPVVIDSSGTRQLLLEGRHRVASAAAAGKTSILAFDLGYQQ